MKSPQTAFSQLRDDILISLLKGIEGYADARRHDLTRNATRVQGIHIERPFHSPLGKQVRTKVILGAVFLFFAAVRIKETRTEVSAIKEQSDQ
ncbi:hypothetical protein [Pseudomonas tolaasii]|uniref:hypothetical protein n=1 Tax=Pseudomonas tolaasii TaxID=29442 RepID=UPI001C42F9E2|nr:hypothetical protein [Pseudomonas tolaasii]